MFLRVLIIIMIRSRKHTNASMQFAVHLPVREMYQGDMERPLGASSCQAAATYFRLTAVRIRQGHIRADLLTDCDFCN